MNIRKITSLTFIAASCVLIVGCSSPNNDLRQELDSLTANVKGKIEPLPVLVPYEAFTYQADALLDPFSSIKITAKFRNSEINPDIKRKKEYLESFPTESIKMVGFVILEKVKYAVVDVEGLTYKVKVGSYMGQNMGQVTSITESGLMLKELTEESGGWAEKLSELSIQGTTTAKGKK